MEFLVQTCVNCFIIVWYNWYKFASCIVEFRSLRGTDALEYLVIPLWTNAGF